MAPTVGVDPGTVGPFSRGLWVDSGGAPVPEYAGLEQQQPILDNMIVGVFFVGWRLVKVGNVIHRRLYSRIWTLGLTDASRVVGETTA